MAWPAALTTPLLVVLGGVVLVAIGLALGRSSGAQMRLGRRLAGAPEVRVGDLATTSPLPRGPLRVAGRVRCADPIVTQDGERLVAMHRTVEVRLARAGWRPIERVRETRGFQLWDHSGQITIDPGGWAEPLLVIPAVWQGPADELPESYAPAIAALEARLDDRAVEARAETRTVSVVDHLLVLAQPAPNVRGEITLAPPRGGYLISGVPLDSAMRLLGGQRRRRLFGAVALVALGALTIAVGVISLIFAVVA